MTKILFIGNAASISFLVGNELKKRGYKVSIIGNESIFQTNKFIKAKPKPPKPPGLVNYYLRKYCKPLHNVVFNRSESFDIELRSFSDPAVKAKHRAVIYHGNDLRDKLWPVCYPCFYSTVELGLFYLDSNKIKNGEAVWLPRCVVSEFFHPEPRMPFDGKHLIVGHFPTDPEMEARGLQGKGSRYLYSAIDILRNRGYEVALLTPQTMGHVAHDQMSELYRRCHVIADQFLVGQYGVTALEAILTDRPVVCYIPERHWEYEEMNSQIVNCTQDPESIADALLAAVDHKVNPDLIKKLYSPEHSADVLENALNSWGFIK